MEKHNSNKLKPLTIISIILSVISVILSIYVVNYPLQHADDIFHPGTPFGFMIIIIGVPLLIAMFIALAINIVNFIKIRKDKPPFKSTANIISLVSLIFSCLFIVAIPISIMNFNTANNIYKNNQAQLKQQKTDEEKAQQTSAESVAQLDYYNSCYSYDQSETYRAARDAICSYMRYLYINNFNEPATGEDLLLNNGDPNQPANYVPSYFYKLSLPIKGIRSNFVSTIKIDPEATIRRSDLISNIYTITPHKNCSRENDNSTISVWYIDSPEPNKEDSGTLSCLYFDSRKSAYSFDMINSESDPFDLYSPNSKEFYETSFSDLHNHIDTDKVLYTFTVPYYHRSDSFTYDNTEFINTLFSD